MDNLDFKQRVVTGLIRVATIYGTNPILANHLSGARAFAVALLIDLPEVNCSQAESLADAAIAKGLESADACETCGGTGEVDAPGITKDPCPKCS